MECRKCMTGRYCPNKAMNDIQNYLCNSGYKCGAGLTTATPIGLANGDVCSKGKYCSGALIHEMDCPDGFYSDKTGLSICQTCPVGKFCDSAVSVEPISCITNSTCDLGVKRQPICPAGMYKYKDAAG